MRWKIYSDHRGGPKQTYLYIVTEYISKFRFWLGMWVRKLIDVTRGRVKKLLNSSGGVCILARKIKNLSINNKISNIRESHDFPVYTYPLYERGSHWHTPLSWQTPWLLQVGSPHCSENKNINAVQNLSNKAFDC